MVHCANTSAVLDVLNDFVECDSHCGFIYITLCLDRFKYPRVVSECSVNNVNHSTEWTEMLILRLILDTSQMYSSSTTLSVKCSVLDELL